MLFMLLVVGSLAEPTITNPATTSFERAGDNATLEVKEVGKLRTISVIGINHPLRHAAALFQDHARVAAYAGPQVTSIQYKGLLEVSDVPYVPGEPPFGVGHPEDVDERVRVVRFNVGKKFPAPNENEVGDT